MKSSTAMRPSPPAVAHPERGFYNLLAQYPAFTFSASVATITGLLFYVTSADSGALVLGNFTSKLKDINSDAPNWLRIFWSVVIGLLTLGMLMTNGISALQNATVIMGLPFSFVIFFVMAGLYKSLKVEDYRRESANRDTAPRPLGVQDRLSWKKRLSRLMNYPGTRYTRQMMETVCFPAMEEVAQELKLRGAYVELKSLPPEEGDSLGHLTCWCIWATSRTLFIRSGRSSTPFPALPTGRAAGSRPTIVWRPSCWKGVRATT
jgi:choline/glycine/proline betaine transport protein